MSDSCNAQVEQEGSALNTDLDKEKLDDVAGGTWWDHGEVRTCKKCGASVPLSFWTMGGELCPSCAVEEANKKA